MNEFELSMEQFPTLQCVCILMQNISGWQPAFKEGRRANQTGPELDAIVRASYVDAVYFPASTVDFDISALFLLNKK